MPIILVIIISLFILLIAWTFNSLKGYSMKQKIIYLILGTLIMLAITTVLVSQNQIEISNEKIVSYIKIINIALFTPINCLIIMPYMARIFNRYNLQEINKGQFKRRSIIIFFVFILVLIFEVGYIENFNKIFIVSEYNSMY